MTAVPDAGEAAARALSTQTTQKIRWEYGAYVDWQCVERRAEFDRWLAEHDAQVAQQALLDAKNADWPWPTHSTTSPIVMHDWFTARAATLAA